jgi:hypothetical protein
VSDVWAVLNSDQFVRFVEWLMLGVALTRINSLRRRIAELERRADAQNKQAFESLIKSYREARR